MLIRWLYLVEGIRQVLKGGVVLHSPDEAFSGRRTLPHGHVAAVPGMLDWLLERQRWIERGLARRHLAGSTLVLYDVTSSYLEGCKCPLAQFGYNRDGKQGKKQIAIGLLCTRAGCPIAVEVFSGNIADPATVAAQVQKLQSRFGVQRIALVGDRGMLTTARLRETVQPAGLDWISALKTVDLRTLLKPLPGGGPAPLQPETLTADTVAEIASPDFPGERLFSRNEGKIAAEARFDGICIVRTSLDENAIGAHEAVAAYKSLSRVERAFRNLKSTRLEVRPVHVYSTARVRAHVFLCTLACYVEWRLRRRLAPMLFEEDIPESARTQRSSPVQKAMPSQQAQRKTATKTTADGLPVHSLPTLLDDLATLSVNVMTLANNTNHPFTIVTQPTPLQSQVFKRLGVNPAKMFPVRTHFE